MYVRKADEACKAHMLTLTCLRQTIIGTRTMVVAVAGQPGRAAGLHPLDVK